MSVFPNFKNYLRRINVNNEISFQGDLVKFDFVGHSYFTSFESFVHRVGFVIAERILYLPSIGFCPLIAVGLKKLHAWKVSKWWLI